MKSAVRLSLSVLLAATTALGSYGGEIDPASNLRPNNITGLMYYLYRWTGSYYNGTTTIRIEPQDFIEDNECDTFQSSAIEISYDSILAIVKSNRYIEDNNELTFSLRTWDKSVNITPTSNTADGPINEIQNFDSVEMNRYDEPTFPPPPYWRLNTSHLSDASYAFSGCRNWTWLQTLDFNYSQCMSRSNALYRGHIQEPESRGRDSKRQDLAEGLNITDFPRVTGRFDNSSASLEIRGIFSGYAHVEGPMSYIGGPITISFLGVIDGNRSDMLMSSSNDTPEWNATLGYSQTICGEAVSEAGRHRPGDMWMYSLGLLSLSLWFL